MEKCEHPTWTCYPVIPTTQCWNEFRSQDTMRQCNHCGEWLETKRDYIAASLWLGNLPVSTDALKGEGEHG